MRILIDIPEVDFIAIKCEGLYFIDHDRLDVSVTKAFQSAKVIPEDCGDLIDRDEFRSQLPAPIEDEYKYVHKLLDNVEAIISEIKENEDGVL